MNINKLTAGLFVLVLSSTMAFAEKPEWAAKEKPNKMQQEQHKAAMQAKDDAGILEQEAQRNRDKDKDKAREKEHAKSKAMDEQQDSMKGLEKQKEKKAAMTQKELDKGSEQGQEARENRKKWWKFWGE